MSRQLIELSDEEEIYIPPARSADSDESEEYEESYVDEYPIPASEETFIELNDNLEELNSHLFILNRRMRKITPKSKAEQKAQKKKKARAKKGKNNDQITPPIKNQLESKQLTVYSDHRARSDKRLVAFVDFCCEKKLFHDQHLNLADRDAIFETGLPETFESICKNKKGISKQNFIRYFRQQQYSGDLKYLFQQLDRRRHGLISWEDFADFFFPFIRKVVIEDPE